MQAQPELDRRFRQEWSAGEAEDQFRARRSATRRSRSRTVGSRTRSGPRRRRRSNPPSLDNKQYVRGIGEVLELAVKGPVEKLELVDVLS